MTKKVTRKKSVAAKRTAAKKSTSRKSSSYYVVDSKGRKTNMKLTLSR